MDSPRFLADCMLGTLATWLRVLGYDAAYYPRLGDNEAVRLARAEGRILLTRDTGLLRRKGLQCLFIESESLDDQIAQVVHVFGLRTENPFSRCPLCNTVLEEVLKSEAWGQVPPFVFQTQEQFRLCPECNRFFWRGTHWQRMLERVQKLRN